jgi:hypothetical protein
MGSEKRTGIVSSSYFILEKIKIRFHEVFFFY